MPQDNIGMWKKLSTKMPRSILQYIKIEATRKPNTNLFPVNTCINRGFTLKFVLNREIGTTPLSQFHKYLVGVIAKAYI